MLHSSLNDAGSAFKEAFCRGKLNQKLFHLGLSNALHPVFSKEVPARVEHLHLGLGEIIYVPEILYVYLPRAYLELVVRTFQIARAVNPQTLLGQRMI